MTSSFHGGMYSRKGRFLIIASTQSVLASVLYQTGWKIIDFKCRNKKKIEGERCPSAPTAKVCKPPKISPRLSFLLAMASTHMVPWRCDKKKRETSES